jgi:hypothetical protein
MNERKRILGTWLREFLADDTAPLRLARILQVGSLDTRRFRSSLPMLTSQVVAG